MQPFFDLDNCVAWKKHWKEMPEFQQKDTTSYQSVIIHFENKSDRNKFSELINQKITDQTKYIYYPKQTKENLLKKVCTASKSKNPKYPIYIISKGRWESRLTSKALEKLSIPYHIVIEPQEYNNYAKYIDLDKILVLPFSNLGQGSIPARNWVWQHALDSGAKRHWILDDNIRDFYRLNRNLKYRVDSGNIFRVIEIFADRYENVALAGMQYELLVPRKSKVPPFYLNTRIYSCILIDNSIPYRWRGKYNEDTDLSLRVLKDGWCTILFNAFLCDKVSTMTMGGGNTNEIYEQTDNRLEFAESLKEQHPDCVSIIWRYGRWHHYIDYSRFNRNKLKLKEDVNISDKNKEFGMEFKNLD